jgi:hypothetical protein
MDKGDKQRQNWQQELSLVPLLKEDINTLVMDYLVIEGYKEAASKFEKEAGVDSGIKLESISERVAIRNAVQSGDIPAAIERVNDLNPEILDLKPELIFHLKQQHLIELIRAGELEQALEFAQDELAPRGEENVHSKYHGSESDLKTNIEVKQEKQNFQL